MMRIPLHRKGAVAPFVAHSTPNRAPSFSHRGRRGAAVVEFAVLAPLLILFFAIAIDFARVYYVVMVVDNCAWNGAMFGSQVLMQTWDSQNNGGTLNPVQSSQQAALVDGTNLPKFGTSNVTYTGVDPSNSGYYLCTVQYKVTPLTGFWQPITIQRSARVAIGPGGTNNQ